MTKVKLIFISIALLAIVSCNQQQQKDETATIEQPGQVTLPKTAADIPGPVAGTNMTKEYVQAIGRIAYIWG